MKARLHQRGAAILIAMLTVTLVASFAAAAMWQQWRSVEVETAERSRMQASWILSGALDWARLILREDTNGTDHLGEPWAVPLQEARLSTFLAADQGASSEPSLVDNVFLSGQIVDLGSMLYAGNLVDKATVNQDVLASFQRLFTILGLPPAQLDTLVENLRFASDISTDNKSASQAALEPQSLDQMVWLGLPPASVAVLAPYVAMYPKGDGVPTVNLNTASAEVIAAVNPKLSLADAQRVVSARDSRPFVTPVDAGAVLGDKKFFTEGEVPKHVSVRSNYFEVHGRLRMDQVVLHEKSVVNRNGSTVRVLSRERTSESATAELAQQGTRR